ncbi:MAG: ParA family protein [Blastocatellia bacterium]|nr:ParA family protein [Blastocatellia bacterium]
MTLQESAGRLRLTDKRVWQFIEQGRLAAHYDRTLHRWFVFESDLQEFAQTARGPGRPRRTTPSPVSQSNKDGGPPKPGQERKTPMAETRTLAVFNQAGGVGKSTTTRDLGYELATRGQRVLVIDADSQGSLSDFLGLDPYGKPEAEIFWTAVCADMDTVPPLATAFGLTVGVSNLSLIEGIERLERMKDHLRFLKVLDGIKADFDVVLIDCPPSVSEMTVQILLAVDELLIPVQPEQKAIAGLVIVQKEIIKANKRRLRIQNPLRISGIVPTIFNPNLSVHLNNLKYIETIAQTLRCPVLPAVRRLTAVTEASTYGQPLKVYKPSSPANDDMARIVDCLFAETAASV